MVQYRKKTVAGSLEYIDEDGGLGIFKPVVNLAQKMLGITGPPAEESWQKEVRHYDLNGVGILGHSLDIIGFTAAAARLHFVDPISYVEIDDLLLQEKIYEAKWRGDKDIFEMLFVMVRALASVGEIDLVCIDGEYDLFQVSQRVKSSPNELDRRGNVVKWGTVTYKQRNSDKTTDTVTVSKEYIERCFVPQPGANHEAYAPTRRILPVLRLYSQIMTQFQRIAFSNSLMTKGLYLGEDDGDWIRDEEYTSNFDNPSKAVPPIVNDLTQLSKAIAAGESLAPWYPMMGAIEPKAIDLTTSFDEQARQTLKDCDEAIAIGLNLPAKMLLGDNVNHFGEYLQDEQFRTFGVAPLLKIALTFLDKHIYSKYAFKANRAAKLWFSYDHITRTTLNPAQFIELFKIGVVGSAEIQRQLGISPKAGILSPEDIQFRRELLTGDSGLQQAQLSQRDAQRQGQEKQAVPATNPLTNGQMRQESAQKPSKAPSDTGGPLTPNPVTGALKKKT